MGHFSRAKKPLLAFAIGCLCSAAFVETSLRLFGEGFRARIGASNGQATVICLGNSFTAGIGADPGHSYCDYLQRYIDQDTQLAPLKLRVVNLGQSSKNSSMILNDLPATLEHYRPRLALLMVGEPNQWNKFGLSSFENAHGNRWRRILSALREKLVDLRLYRFAVLATRNMNTQSGTLNRRFPHVSRENVINLGFRWLGYLYEPNVPREKILTAAESEEALRSLRAAIEKYPLNSVLPLVLARQQAQSQPADALAWYEKSAATLVSAGVYPYEVERDLLHWQRKWPEKQIAETKNLLARLRSRSPDPDLTVLAGKINSPSEISRLLPLTTPRPAMAAALSTLLGAYPAYTHLRRHLFNYLRERGQSPEANKLVLDGAHENPLTPLDVYAGLLTEARFSNGLKGPALEAVRNRMTKDFPDEAGNFEDHAHGAIAAWTQHDLERIASILRVAQVPAIWQTYPPLRNGARQWVDPIIQAVSAREHAPLVDTYLNLKMILSSTNGLQKIYSDQFGSADPHLNNFGNELVARQLIEAVRAPLLSSPRP